VTVVTHPPWVQDVTGCINLMDTNLESKQRCIIIQFKVVFRSNAPRESCKQYTFVLMADRGIKNKGLQNSTLGQAKVYLAHAHFCIENCI